jgi:hypothetical protein
MTRRRSTFTATDVKRALRAALAVGVPNPEVKIAPDGSITVRSGEKPEPRLQPAPEAESIWKDCA